MTLLIQKHKSIKNLRLLSIDELENTVGKNKAKLVFKHFHNGT